MSSILKHRGKEGMLVKHRYCQSKGKRDQPELGEHAGSRWRQTRSLGGKGETARCLTRTQTWLMSKKHVLDLRKSHSLSRSHFTLVKATGYDL